METPDGPGMVRNIVRRKGVIIAVLVEPDEGPVIRSVGMRPWRSYETNQLVPINPRLV